MIEDLFALKFPPGFFSNGTKLQGEGRWRTGSLVRFFEGTIRPIGGWTTKSLTGDTIVGTIHAIHSWQSADGVAWTAVGTELGLYAISASNVVYDITPTPGIVYPPAGGPFNWQLSAFGSYIVAVDNNPTDSFVTTFLWLAGDTGALADNGLSIETPRGTIAAFGTPERFLVLLGGNDPAFGFPARSTVDPAYSNRRVYWATQESVTEWITSDINTAGNFDLTTDGKLMVGAATRGPSLIWTDDDLWQMKYIGDTFVYAFEQMGQKCGIISKRGYAILDNTAYWMGDGKFFKFDGFVQTLPCDVSEYVFGDFSTAHADKTWAFNNPRFNEITWFYCSSGASTPDRYVTLNHVEGHWVTGTLSRSAGVTKQFGGANTPVLANAAVLYNHETGSDRDGADPAFLDSATIRLGKGDQLVRVQGTMPDDDTVGDTSLTFYASMESDGLEETIGPYVLDTQTPLRFTARYVRVHLEEAVATDWRVGVLQLAGRPAERRGTTISADAADFTPASIELAPTVLTLPVGAVYALSAIVRNVAGRVLGALPTSYTSSNESVATVSSAGVVTVVGDTGTATITGHFDAITGSMTVTATGAGIAPTSGANNLRAFGAIGDGVTDDTAAVQAWITASQFATSVQGVPQAYAPAGNYKITSPIDVTAARLRIRGDGRFNSVFRYDGVTGGAFVWGTMAAANVDIQDIGIIGDDTSGVALDFTNVNQGGDPVVYNSTFANMNILAGKQAIKIPYNCFSAVFNNIFASSETEHVFHVHCGPSVAWIGCYAGNAGVAGTGKAGYRLTGTIRMYDSNGVNQGDFWGVFGAEPASTGDEAAYNADFPTTSYAVAELHGCNIEAYNTGGLWVINPMKQLRLNGVTFVRFLAPAYHSDIRIYSQFAGDYMTALQLDACSRFVGTAPGHKIFMDSTGAVEVLNDAIDAAWDTFWSDTFSINYPVVRVGVVQDASGQRARKVSRFVSDHIISEGDIVARGHILLEGTTSTPGAGLRYIGTGTSSDIWLHNVPDTGRHEWTVQDADKMELDKHNLKILTQHYTPTVAVTADAGTGVFTLDCDLGNVFLVTLRNGTNTPSFTNFRDGATYELWLVQPSSGAAGTLISPAPFRWAFGTPFTLTATNSAVDKLVVTWLNALSAYMVSILDSAY